MRILKRDGVEAEFDRKKIERAIEKANKSVTANERLSEDVIKDIALKIEQDCSAAGTIPTVESVQDKVIYAIMSAGAYVLANNYIIYRYTHALQRQKNTTDDKISAILQLKSQAAMEETRIKTQPSYLHSEITWPAKYLETSHVGSCCRKTSSMLMTKAAFTSMIPTISHRQATTAIWSTWKICCRTALAFPAH